MISGAGVGLRARLSLRAHLLIAITLVVAYFALGVAGLQLQWAQAGVTPVWPASGVAFAVVYWCGLAHTLALVPAMIMLAAFFDIPFAVAALSALGSMIEAAVPVYLLRRLDMSPHVARLRDVLLFVGIGAGLGPLFSASFGTLAFYWLGGSDVEPLRLWLLWWLGNSIGVLTVGGFGLIAVARRTLRLSRQGAWFFAVGVALVALITMLGLQQVPSISSSLIFYLLIPVFVVVALRADQYPVVLLGVFALMAFVGSAGWLPPDRLREADLGLLYLEISLLWVVVFTGMVTAGGRREMREREEVSWLVTHDPLTRLLNRHAFMEHLESLLGKLDGSYGSVLLYLDLDRFKALNDAEGHRAGDRVLRDVSNLLLEELRAGDVVARLGGDEFAIVLERCTLLDACAVAENIRSLVEAYEYEGSNARYRVEVSIGLVELGRGLTSPEDALHKADMACYDAKRAGRNRVLVHADSPAVT